MASPPLARNKRQKREEYLAASKVNGNNGLPKKKFYRQRAHANPFSDHQLTYPANPALMDWSPYFPAYVAPEPPSAPPGDGIQAEAAIRPLVKPVTVADVGCGFGGLLVALSPLLPDELILGLEIRTQVHAFTHSRILALRAQHASTSASQSFQSSSLSTVTKYQNISSLRANTMKFLPNLVPRASLTRLFLCFPDPHFKARKHKARIVSPTLVAEYAYVMREGGWVYVITDVRDLYDWIRACFDGTANSAEQDDNDYHGDGQQPREADARRELWEEVPEEERERDVCMRAVREETEEGRKVQRNGGDKFAACWRRRRDPDWPLDIVED